MTNCYILQCTDYSPCFNGRCINEAPGYQCLACPYGYTGYMKDGRAGNLHNRLFSCGDETEPGNSTVVEQICEDIDECATNNGGCDINAYCQNTPVSNLFSLGIACIMNNVFAAYISCNLTSAFHNLI